MSDPLVITLSEYNALKEEFKDAEKRSSELQKALDGYTSWVGPRQLDYELRLNAAEKKVAAWDKLYEMANDWAATDTPDLGLFGSRISDSMDELLAPDREAPSSVGPDQEEQR